MTYKPHDWWKQELRTCERPGCGTAYHPKQWNQKYCSPSCKMAMSMKEFKARNPEYWENYLRQRRESTKRTPTQVIPWNPRPCALCRLPLGKTLNRWFHADCLRRVSHCRCGGVDEYTGEVA